MQMTVLKIDGYRNKQKAYSKLAHLRTWEIPTPAWSVLGLSQKAISYVLCALSLKFYFNAFCNARAPRVASQPIMIG